MTVTSDRWTCPHDGCEETVIGTSEARRAARRAHARRHGTATDREDDTPPSPALPIPPAPRPRRRRR